MFARLSNGWLILAAVIALHVCWASNITEVEDFKSIDKSKDDSVSNQTCLNIQDDLSESSPLPDVFRRLQSTLNDWQIHFIGDTKELSDGRKEILDQIYGRVYQELCQIISEAWRPEDQDTEKFWETIRTTLVNALLLELNIIKQIVFLVDDIEGTVWRDYSVIDKNYVRTRDHFIGLCALRIVFLVHYKVSPKNLNLENYTPIGPNLDECRVYFEECSMSIAKYKDVYDDSGCPYLKLKKYTMDETYFSWKDE